MAFSLQLIGPMVFDPDDPPLPTLKLTNQSTLYRVSGEKNFIQVFMSFLPKPSIKRDPETFQFQKQRCKKRWIQCRSREKPSKEEKKENLIVHQKLLYNIKLAWNLFEGFPISYKKKRILFSPLSIFFEFLVLLRISRFLEILAIIGQGCNFYRTRAPRDVSCE